MDIATYDHLDLAARATLPSWTHEAVFAPVTFQMTGFPTRIGHIGQIRGVLSGLHGSDRIPRQIEELGGLRDDDLKALRQAILGFVRWQRTGIPAPAGGDVPLADLLSQYIAWRKLHALAAAHPTAGRARKIRGANVLEIGAGYGLTSLFIARDSAIGHYTAVEIAQPLYIIQSLLGSSVFGDEFSNHALAGDGQPPIGSFRAARDREHGRFRFLDAVPTRAELFPWWRLDEAIGWTPRYDVIMSNGNLAEMALPALDWYVPRWAAALADDGYLLVQDLGKVTTRQPGRILASLDAAGFRALARGHARAGELFMPLFTLVLVTERHPHYGQALPLSETLPFIGKPRAIREAFGLDREPGRMLTVPQLADELRLEVW